MEIKRVIAGGLATLAAGATLALGAGAVTLGDFVTVSGNTMTSPYIVIGGNAAAEDTLAAADVGVALAGQATQTVSIPGSQGTMSVSDGAMIETSSRHLYFGEAFNDANIKPKVLSKDLPTLLAAGFVKDTSGESIDYSQYLTMGAQSVAFARDSKWADPALYVDLVKSANLYTYEVIFSQGLDTTKIRNKEITLLGTPYVFSDSATDLDGNKLILYGAGQTENIVAGGTLTVTVAGEEYVITVTGVNEAGTAAGVDINGEDFSVDTTDTSTMDISKGDLNLHVKSVNAYTFPTSMGSLDVFVGSEKTTLEDVVGSTDEVILGSTGVDGTVLTITNTTTKVDKITITYAIQDKQKLQAGESVTDPVFGAFKIAFGGIYPALDVATKDVVEIEKSGDDTVDVSWTNRDGIEYDMTMLYLNTSSCQGLDISDGSNRIHMSNNATLSENDFVIVTTGTGNERYSYILEFTDYTSDDEVILTDVSSGSDYTISTNTEYIYPGESGSAVSITSFKPGASESVSLNNTGGPVNELATMYTAQGAVITFGVGNSTEVIGGTGAKVCYTGYINVTEHTFKSTDDVAEETIEVTTSNTTEVSNIVGGGVTMVADDDNDYKYGVSAAGTYAIEDVENDIVTIHTPEEPTPVFVAIGTNPTFSSAEGASAGSVEQAVQIKNSVSKMESEIVTASLDRDLVLLGGPCANSLVAELLEMSSTSPACATEFTALHPTEGVITVVSDAFSSGQKALVIAGVDRSATRALAVKVMQGTVEYSA